MGSSRSARADWRALRALTGSEWRTLALAALLLPISAVSLRLIGYYRVQRIVARLFPLHDAPPADELARAVLTARLVGVAARRSPLRATCLPRSVVLWALLRRHGIDATVTHGVRREGGEFGAHSWVEWRGVVINDAEGVEDLFTALELPRE